jgi:SsrA-binding protein
MSLISNKKIYTEFKIVEKMVFGIELLGSEVKSLKKSQGNLDGGRVIVKNNELFILGFFIPAYQQKNNSNLDTYRIRKLLATKKDIVDINALGTGNNLHIVPTSIFIKGNKIKLECAIATKLNKQDKRQVIKERDLNRKG